MPRGVGQVSSTAKVADANKFRITTPTAKAKREPSLASRQSIAIYQCPMPEFTTLWMETGVMVHIFRNHEAITSVGAILAGGWSHILGLLCVAV